MIIDSHHHFWNYNPVEYEWIGEDMNNIRRNFLPSDLKNEIDQAGVTGVISVQARQTIVETDWLLQLANENEFIKGVVGWLPINNSDFKSCLDRYSKNNKLCALRHVIQDEPDPEFILKKEFNDGIAQLKYCGLAFDILVYEHQLPNTITFVDKHPEQVFILDHIAKPKIRENLLDPWRKNIRGIAKKENVYCKISGMVTEANFTSWTKKQLYPYFETILEAFGADRLMFGSDWPVCLVAVSYNDWLNIVKEFLSKISINEQNKILFKNAIEAYDLAS